MKMNIQELIGENEKIIWEGTPDEVCYTWSSIIPMIPFAILWLMFDTFFIVTIFSTEIGGGFLWFAIPFFILHLMPVWATIGRFAKNKLEHKNVVYAITDKRVIMRDGIIGIDFKSIDFAEIDHVQVNVNILERIRNVGTVICKVDGQNYNVFAIKDPYEVFKKLQKISFDVKTDIEYPNAKRPKENPGYQTEYKSKE